MNWQWIFVNIVVFAISFIQYLEKMVIEKLKSNSKFVLLFFKPTYENCEFFRIISYTLFWLKMSDRHVFRRCYRQWTPPDWNWKCMKIFYIVLQCLPKFNRCCHEWIFDACGFIDSTCVQVGSGEIIALFHGKSKVGCSKNNTKYYIHW